MTALSAGVICVIMRLYAPAFRSDTRRWSAATGSCIVLFIRTNLEDRTLHEELPGYREYAQRVRYRRPPCVW